MTPTMPRQRRATTRRTYTDTQRQTAIEMAAEHGIAHTHRATKIPKGTLSKWCTKAGVTPGTVAAKQTAAATVAAQLEWASRRTVMVHEMGAAAQTALTRCQATLSNPGADPRKAKDLALTMAILVDKAQLLAGDATARFGSQADREAALAAARDTGLRLVS